MALRIACGVALGMAAWCAVQLLGRFFYWWGK